MSSSINWHQNRQGSVRLPLLVSLALLLGAACLWAEAPAWWAQRGVLNTTSGVIADDYAVVNQGQVKNIAKQAYEEFKAKLPGGAGSALTAIWETPAASTDDYQAINLGQLKHVAKPFYDRLIAEGLATDYPWAGSPTPADNYALANSGQVKNLFSFSIPPPSFDDTDGDGMSDEWEIANGLDPLVDDADDDVDGDGVSNGAEFQAGLSAVEPDANELGLVIYTP